MKLDKKQITAFIREKSSRPMRLKELAAALDISKSDYREFRDVVHELIQTGELVKLKRNRIGIASELDIAVGILSVTRSGIGFLIRENVDQDILIPESHLLTAFDGDKVMVRLTGTRAGRPAGSVIRIIERAARNIVGVFHRSKSFAFVVSDNKRIHRDILIPDNATKGAQPGEKVVVKLEYWEDPYLNPEGRVTERLGFPGDPGVDMLTIIKSFNLPEEFPVDVLDEAERASAQDVKDIVADREDLTRDCIYTIDPADAKDHDDAVTVTRLDNGGYRLGVHIADVAFFVAEGSRLDKEAFRRGNSVYLPGMVIPMLPELLSNDVCSLKPNRKRLAHSVEMDFDSTGKMLSWRVFDAVIKSQARLAYEEVQEFFDTGTAATRKIERVADNLTVARQLARLLCQRRFAEGSLDFDLPEAKIVLDQKGNVLEVGNRIRLESHRLVEEFMLAANKAVALDVFRKAQPFVYRVHDRPDFEKVSEFSEMMARLGYSFPASREMRPKQFADFLKKVEGTPEEGFINELLLRSMKKAVYQRKNIGHFGLAFRHYTHFTSPIRRYPDLLVHRLLRMLRGGTPGDYARTVTAKIDRACKHCSETERVAESAERQAVKVKQVAYMAKHVGDHFDGVITGVNSYGFFVRLDNLGVEGLVKVSNIDDDYYRFEENRYQLKGRRRGRSYRLGGRVKVGVLNVNTANHELDLFPVGGSTDKGNSESRSNSSHHNSKRPPKSGKKPLKDRGNRQTKEKKKLRAKKRKNKKR